MQQDESAALTVRSWSGVQSDLLARGKDPELRICVTRRGRLTSVHGMEATPEFFPSLSPPATVLQPRLLSLSTASFRTHPHFRRDSMSTCTASVLRSTRVSQNSSLWAVSPLWVRLSANPGSWQNAVFTICLQIFFSVFLTISK